MLNGIDKIGKMLINLRILFSKDELEWALIKGAKRKNKNGNSNKYVIVQTIMLHLAFFCACV
jgi:hypothetical protein